jgi:energy-coupling factor transporter ATP-binding protein EcfA2
MGLPLQLQALDVQHPAARAGAAPALRAFSVQLAAGEQVAVIGPSGAGKSSLVNALLAREPSIQLSISYTSRAPRPGESEGSHYHFVSREQFEAMVGRGEFFEHALVHGDWKGTARHTVEAMRRRGASSRRAAMRSSGSASSASGARGARRARVCTSGEGSPVGDSHQPGRIVTVHEVEASSQRSEQNQGCRQRGGSSTETSASRPAK